jgi:hypothetical protein
MALQLGAQSATLATPARSSAGRRGSSINRATFGETRGVPQGLRLAGKRIIVPEDSVSTETSGTGPAGTSTSTGGSGCASNSLRSTNSRSRSITAPLSSSIRSSISRRIVVKRSSAIGLPSSSRGSGLGYDPNGKPSLRRFSCPSPPPLWPLHLSVNPVTPQAAAGKLAIPRTPHASRVAEPPSTPITPPATTTNLPSLPHTRTTPPSQARPNFPTR